MSDAGPDTVRLTSGWEPDVPVTDTIARRFVVAYADRVAAMAEPAGRVRDVDGARMVDLGSPFGYDNAVVLLRPPASAAELAELVAQAHAFYPPERWWVLLSLFTTGDLRGEGLTLVGHPPVMVRTPAPLPAPPPGLELRTVDDPATLADFCRVLVAGFGMAEVGVPAIADLGLARSLLRLVVGYADGEPVSTAGGATRHGIVEVDWVATLPTARRRGFGGAVTAAVLDPGLPAVLLASDDGQPVYRRLGFWDVFRATMWEHPPSP